MDKELLNILKTGEDTPEEQQIIDYLKGMLDDKMQHQLEAQELNDDLVRDALEGLGAVKDKSKLEKITREMNAALQNKLDTRKNRRKEKRKLKNPAWIILSIITVLLLICIAFLVYKTVRG